MTAPPPLTTTLDDDVANMRKVLPQVVAEIERRALAAQPAPPAEALRLLRELPDAIEAWAAGEGKFPGHRLDNAIKGARRYLAATEEG